MGQIRRGQSLLGVGNGDVPVWTLLDAVAALQETALALSSTPTDIRPALRSHDVRRHSLNWCAHREPAP
jgi:hypothetical protein